MPLLFQNAKYVAGNILQVANGNPNATALHFLHLTQVCYDPSGGGGRAALQALVKRLASLSEAMECLSAQVQKMSTSEKGEHCCMWHKKVHF